MSREALTGSIAASLVRAVTQEGAQADRMFPIIL
jgi:hypothetical protein